MSPMPTLARISSIVNRLSCRHSYVRRAAVGRLWLECSECQHETPGVQISARAEAEPGCDLDAIVALT